MIKLNKINLVFFDLLYFSCCLNEQFEIFYFFQYYLEKKNLIVFSYFSIAIFQITRIVPSIYKYPHVNGVTCSIYRVRFPFFLKQKSLYKYVK